GDEQGGLCPRGCRERRREREVGAAGEPRELREVDQVAEVDRHAEDGHRRDRDLEEALALDVPGGRGERLEAVARGPEELLPGLPLLLREAARAPEVVGARERPEEGRE